MQGQPAPSLTPTKKLKNPCKSLDSIHGRKLVIVLFDALGLTPDEVLELTLGDLFEYDQHNDRAEQENQKTVRTETLSSVPLSQVAETIPERETTANYYLLRRSFGIIIFKLGF